MSNRERERERERKQFEPYFVFVLVSILSIVCGHIATNAAHSTTHGKEGPIHEVEESEEVHL